MNVIDGKFGQEEEKPAPLGECLEICVDALGLKDDVVRFVLIVDTQESFTYMTNELDEAQVAFMAQKMIASLTSSLGSPEFHTTEGK